MWYLQFQLVCDKLLLSFIWMTSFCFLLQWPDRILIIAEGVCFLYSSLKLFWTPDTIGGFRYTNKNRVAIATLFPFGSPNWARTSDIMINSHALYRLSYGGIYKCWRLPIFTGRFQPTIFGTTELNFCVRDGNRWTLSVINTNYLFTSIHFSGSWWPVRESNSRCRRERAES